MTQPTIPAPVLAGPCFGDLLLDAIERHGPKPAIIDDGVTYSYAELGERIARALAIFRRLGLQPGDTIAQLSSNSVWLYATMAAAYIGGYRSVTLHAMGGLEDHAYILEDSEAMVLLADAAHADRALALDALVARPVFLHDSADPLPCFWRIDCGPMALPQRATGESETIIRLAYTGGTTGRPKGVMLSNRALVTNTVLALGGIDWPQEIRFLCPAPISHGAGSIVAPTLIRGGVVILQKSFSAEAFATELARTGANLTWLVPTMIVKLLEWLEDAGAETDLSSLETLIYSGAPMAPAHIRRALDRLGPVLFQCYGQTEAPNTILRLTREDHQHIDEARLRSAGRPFPGVEVVILREDGSVAPRGEAGEICVRGALLMTGYWRLPEASAEAFEGGWLHTGDIGSVDDSGYVHIVDRKKDMVISGGFNVYPKEIEDILLRHDGVADVAVVGLPDATWGEAVKAVVVLRSGAEVSAGELMNLVRAAKGPVQTPKSVDFVEAIPLTALGKPDKKAIRAAYAKVA